MPQIPIYGLVDYDPHGVRILRTYKYGSLSLGHEIDADVPNMEWLGIRSLDLQQQDIAGQPWPILSDAICLTETDRKAATGLLREIVWGYDEDSPSSSMLMQCREIQVMLMLNIKAEIQAVDDHGDLASWLDEKLGKAQKMGCAANLC